jgi:site-specific recombinase XerD
MEEKKVENGKLIEQRVISIQELLNWIEGLMLDRKSRGYSNGTIYFYKVKLQLFINYCNVQQLNEVDQITSVFIRSYLT